MLKLTKAERKALRLYHLGGIGAWRTETAHVAVKTINSLFAKGLFFRDGATDLGKRIAEQVADEEHARSTNWQAEGVRDTRFPELGYKQIDLNCWMVIDKSDYRQVGPQYRTKAELLADLERYAVAFGCAG